MVKSHKEVLNDLSLVGIRSMCGVKTMHLFIPKKLLLIVGGVLILLIGIGIGSGTKQSQPSTPLSAPPAPLSIEKSIPSSSTTDISSAGLIKVVRVIDGDTIEIEGGERVRYIGIDTPETVDPRKPVQCFGVEASRKNKELVEGKEIRLEKDITDRDKYGRLLRYVWVGDTLINLELVKQGFASSYSYPPDIKYQDDFVEAEREARDAKRGLWDACQQADSSTVAAPVIAPSPSQTETSVVAPVVTTPPSLQTETSSAITPTSCIIKGNINSSGEMIYHLPGCGSYNATKIDEGRGEKWFCSESQALATGWRKALNCP